MARSHISTGWWIQPVLNGSMRFSNSWAGTKSRDLVTNVPSVSERLLSSRTRANYLTEFGLLFLHGLREELLPIFL